MEGLLSTGPTPSSFKLNNGLGPDVIHLKKKANLFRRVSISKLPGGMPLFVGLSGSLT